jgi:hypothetical protein
VYAEGSVVAFTAPELFAGKRFAHWTLDGEPLSTSPRIFLMVETDMTLEARYVDDLLVGRWRLDEGGGTSALHGWSLRFPAKAANAVAGAHGC